jgi:hypothetical protein
MEQNEYHGLGADTAVGSLGATVAALSWTQTVTGLESVIIGALTIVLVCLRIYRHLRPQKNPPAAY